MDLTVFFKKKLNLDNRHLLAPIIHDTSNLNKISSTYNNIDQLNTDTTYSVKNNNDTKLINNSDNFVIDELKENLVINQTEDCAGAGISAPTDETHLDSIKNINSLSNEFNEDSILMHKEEFDLDELENRFKKFLENKDGSYEFLLITNIDFYFNNVFF